MDSASIKDLVFERYDNPKVSIIIPVYNQIQHTINCLRSILEVNDTTEVEVIVIDDCSTDETKELLSKVKGLVYHRNTINQGYVRNNNLGAQMARGEYLMLLNNDTEVTDHYLERLLEIFEIYPKAAVAGSKLIYPNGTVQEAGSHLYQDGRGFNYGKGYVHGEGNNADDYRYNFVRPVDYCSAAAILVKKSIWDELEGFDEAFIPAYCEDSDFQFRAREAGYVCYYQPLSVVVHYEGVSNGIDKGAQTTGVKKYQEVNRLKFIKKHKEYLYAHAYKDGEKPHDQMIFPKNKEHIYVIDEHILQPDCDSGSQKIFNFMKILQEKYQVTFIVKNPDFNLTEEQFEKYYKMHVEQGFRVLINRGKNKEVDIVQFFKENRDQPKYVLLSRPDVAIAMFNHVKRHLHPNVKILFDTADMHHLRMITQIKHIEETNPSDRDGRNFFQDLYYKFRAIETFLVSQVDEIWAITEEEKQYIISTLHADEKKIKLVPNVLDIPATKNGYKTRKDMMFIGGFSHTPNVDAIKYYQEKIVPELKKRGLDITLHVIGSQSERLQNIPNEMMNVIGFVEDPTPYFNDSLIAFYPLITGAGMKGKITQALGMGLPVVTTEIGAQGYIGAENYMLVENDPVKLVDAIETYIQSEALWNNHREEGLKYFNENFSFDALRKILRNL